MINVTGVLVDPTGTPLANHDIRITDSDEISSIETTDGTGTYAFVLADGTYQLEILFNHRYMLTGDLIVNSGTPTPIDIPSLIVYSSPVELDNMDMPVYWQTLVDTIENSPSTRSRTHRDQMADTLVHVADIKTTDVSDDELERKATHDVDLKSCDAQVSLQHLVYSDDAENYLATSGSIVKSKTASVVENLVVTGDITKGTTLTSVYGTSITTIKLDDVSYEDKTVVTADGKVTTTTLSNVGKTFIVTKDGKLTSDVHTNNGTLSNKTIIVDNHIIGRDGNNTFEVDTVNDIVHVRGALRVSALQDENGTPIDVSDGDTIFQVFEFSDSATGPWHELILPSDYWRRDALSVNGVVGAFGVAYQFRADTAVGDSGDTIYIEFQYSPDGVTSWTPTMEAGDAFRRERTVTNGVPGVWSDVSRIKGDNGDEIEIRSQYSVDGINFWHDTFVIGDKYERRGRFINGVQDGPYSDPFQVVVNDSFKSTAYKRLNGNLGVPTGGTWTDPIPTTVGFSDGVPAGTAQLHMTTRIFTRDGTPPQQAAWSQPVKVTDTATIDFEFSAIASTGNPGDPGTQPGNWHNTATSADVWMAVQSIENGVGLGWEVTQIKGESGDDGNDGVGIPGLNGSGWYSIVKYGGIWPGTSAANADFINEFGRVPQLDDHLFYVNSLVNATVTDGRRCITPAGGGTPQWNSPVAYFDGDVIVKGTMSADRIVSNSITGNEFNSQTTMISGSGSNTAGMNGYDGATLPAWLGGGPNVYQNYRFWSGASDPDFANFRVSRTGYMYASNVNIAGTVTTTNLTATDNISIGATSGSRIHISEDKLEVYDGTTLRVKIGNLA